jgi:hypothetical protein
MKWKGLWRGVQAQTAGYYFWHFTWWTDIFNLPLETASERHSSWVECLLYEHKKSKSPFKNRHTTASLDIAALQSICG